MKTINLIIVVILCIVINLSIGTTICVSSAHASLIFSEYVEGSSNNKALEIYNSGSIGVGLADYSVEVYHNGSTEPTHTISLLDVTLSSGNVFVIANLNADPVVLGVADQTSGSIAFNGDDAITLVYNTGSSVVDSIGKIGEDPGDYWGTGSVTTRNHTLRRKNSVDEGDTVTDDAFNPADEWDAFDQDTFNGLGLPGSQTSAVPIPGAVWLLGSGLVGIVGIRRKLKK